VDEHTVLDVKRSLETARAAADARPRIVIGPYAGDDVERRRLEHVQHATEIRAPLEDHVVVSEQDARRLDLAEASIAPPAAPSEL